jgi:hypothetical protein
VTFDVAFALDFKVGHPLTDLERRVVAKTIVDYLQLSNWMIERGPPGANTSPENWPKRPNETARPKKKAPGHGPGLSLPVSANPHEIQIRPKGSETSQHPKGTTPKGTHYHFSPPTALVAATGATLYLGHE